MGHGALGVIESVGSGAESLQVGDHIAIPDTLDSGPLNMARAGVRGEFWRLDWPWGDIGSFYGA
jgi:threonine dehydrogenase-like Zn-dependent dehydrogenase